MKIAWNNYFWSVNTPPDCYSFSFDIIKEEKLLGEYIPIRSSILMIGTQSAHWESIVFGHGRLLC